jgi:hypothetical protein
MLGPILFAPSEQPANIRRKVYRRRLDRWSQLANKYYLGGIDTALRDNLTSKNEHFIW